MLLNGIDEASKMEEKITVTGEEWGARITLLLVTNTQKKSLKCSIEHKLHNQQKAVKAKRKGRSLLKSLFKSLFQFCSECI